jgi:hypothetical protein
MKEPDRLLNELTAAPYAIARQIAADIEILTKAGQTRVAGGGDREYRTGFRVRLRKAEKVVGQRLWQNHQISLYVARRQTCGVAGEFTLSKSQPFTGAGGGTPLSRVVHRSIRMFAQIILAQIREARPCQPSLPQLWPSEKPS